MINKELMNEFITVVKNSTDKDDMMKDIIMLFKKYSVADGIGIRLKDGDDYPYYTTVGFSDHFIKAENYLCKRDECGKVIRGEDSKPILECMCGDIINKKVDINEPYYTKHGSFIMGEPCDQVFSLAKKMNCLIRGKCINEGYKSIAIIPIHYENDVIGLIQLNSFNINVFTNDIIETVEEISVFIGRAIGKLIEIKQGEKERKDSIAKEMKEKILDLKSFASEFVKKYS